MLDARKHYLVRNSFLAKMCFNTIKPDACLGDTDYVLLLKFVPSIRSKYLFYLNQRVKA